MLAPGGTLVAVGGPKRNLLIGPLGNRLWLKLRSVPGDRRVTLMLAKVTRVELEFLGGLLEEGSVTPVVERTYGLAETAKAFDRLGQGHAQGKLVVTV